ncbi:aldehyde dehydrogenase family protein [Elizabethkingia argentiflava]|uniref:Aldehyde dehydrogenase family protein n=1 Tax=Elizabethkingia argenteiflava TaxID=2681556 RepID=A0A845PSU8_9FLAO|nr:aldehyde dehydrogenase family protein [Elizabethkingia argenteiflava]NAW51302.1 aldehyde dehydrogenase family protein [Elizabethkingia argenteiflava]
MLNIEQTQAKLEQADKAFMEWRKVTFEERQRLLSAVAHLLLEKADTLANIITKEMNKPVSQSIAEIEKCAALIHYYVKADNILKPEIVETPYSVSEIQHSPMGVILGIMPWNYPFWQVIRFAIPAILAGNTVVLKHASICFESGNTIQKIFEEAGLPQGIFLHLEIGHRSIKDVLENPIVKGVSLTGSELAGTSVAALAGANIKKSVLELGGSDAFIVLADADFDQAAEVGAESRLQNCGQVCVAAKRFIIHQAAEEAFLPKFIQAYKKFIPGDPQDKNTKISGMSRKDLADELEAQYQKAIRNGAEVIIALERVSDLAFNPGLIKVKEGNPILEEELFGPLGMVLIGEDDEDCLRLANTSRFGLGSAVWTQQKEKALFFAENLEAGTVAINKMTKTMPEMPCGGVKYSGYGTELSLQALKEFTVPKSVVGII